MKAGRIAKMGRALALAGVVALCLGFSVPTSALAAVNPSTELAQAVARTGAASIETARADQFIHAFSAVLARKKTRDFSACVTAALNVRADLADKIVAAALSVLRLKSHGQDVNTDLTIEQIVEAAIAADPAAAGSIVRAAILAYPEAKEVIIAAALKVAPDQELAILRASGDIPTISFLQSTGPASINPVNSRGIEPVNSPEQPPSGP